MTTVAVICARMGSTRLPGKVLADLAGKPMVKRIRERAGVAQSLDGVIVATGPRQIVGWGGPWPDNSRLTEAAREVIFTPHEDDVLARLLVTSGTADWIVRIPGDNPCIEPAEIDRIVAFAQADNTPGTLYSNISPFLDNGYPDGIGAEVYSRKLLEAMDELLTEPQYREHPHLWFHEHGRVKTVQCPEAFACPTLRLDVNTQADLDRIRGIYEALGPDFHVTDVIDYFNRRGAGCETY